MRPTEARWIARQLAALPAKNYAPLLNVGSSTAEFRQVRHPHIDAIIFAPLRLAGVHVIHTDLKAAPGVDIAGDMTDPDVQACLREQRPGMLLCSNLLEHVSQPSVLISAMRSLLSPGGLIIVTVPRSYPYHPDPIDTGFRPTPEELVAQFADCDVLRAETVEDVTYGQELLSLGLRGIVKGVRTLVGGVRPLNPVARAQRHRLRWLFKPFTVSCALLRVAR